jgi:putative AlgH/UPF0301 family transcriptional regulator
MSLGKLCLLTFVATIVVALAAARSKVATPQLALSSHSRWHDPAVGSQESFRYGALSENDVIPLPSVCNATSKTDPSAVLPIQSKNPKDLGAGKLLVASRELADPIFAETVILLVHYDTKGVVGLMLNRRTDVPLSKVLDNLNAAKDRSDPVYLGGPVETPAVFGLLRSTAKLEGAEHVFGAIYWISAKSVFERVISSRPDPGVFRVYLGYAGWTNEQLRKETELGGWFIFEADNRTIFSANPDSLWRQLIKKTELKMAGNQPAFPVNLRTFAIGPQSLFLSATGAPSRIKN